jgi:hypothetical protein
MKYILILERGIHLWKKRQKDRQYNGQEKKGQKDRQYNDQEKKGQKDKQ